jgi:hypothetical protein
MPDAFIRAEFKRWLEEVRKQLKLPVAKPGKYALKSKFDQHKFAAWRCAKIVEFADLLEWHATLAASEQKQWRKSVLGREIGRNSSKDVNTTERILRRALASLPALGAQVEHELAQGQISRRLIAARIAKNIAR